MDLVNSIKKTTPFTLATFKMEKLMEKEHIFSMMDLTTTEISSKIEPKAKDRNTFPMNSITLEPSKIIFLKEQAKKKDLTILSKVIIKMDTNLKVF